MNNLAVEMRNIHKSFDRVQVLNDINFSVYPGEVHALLGGNGAGKSTLMKILIGLYQPDAGVILINGQMVKLQSIEVARRHGIAMIFQEFSLIPSLTVAQNIFLGREPRNRFGLIDDRSIVRLSEQLFASMGITTNTRALLTTLNIAAWQLTEIAKALSQKARILIMDEPTAALTRSETDTLLELIRNLKNQGISIIYITHRMEEVFKIADRITVLRDGGNSITTHATEISLPKVIEHIAGNIICKELIAPSVQSNREPLLSVQNLRSGQHVRGISFDLYAGEVLGFAGLMGSGRTELVRTLFGIDRIDDGKIIVKGQAARIRTPRDAINYGIVLIPEDRYKQGLILNHSIRNNILLSRLHQLQHNFFINDRYGDTITEKLIARLHIRPSFMGSPSRILSGGNQQKVVIAKWIGIGPEIILFDEPTSGIDVGAKAEIAQLINQLAKEGKGIIFISSELSELLSISHRVVILKEGQLVRELVRGEVQTENELHRLLQAT